MNINIKKRAVVAFMVILFGLLLGWYFYLSYESGVFDSGSGVYGLRVVKEDDPGGFIVFHSFGFAGASLIICAGLYGLYLALKEWMNNKK